MTFCRLVARCRKAFFRGMCHQSLVVHHIILTPGNKPTPCIKRRHHRRYQPRKNQLPSPFHCRSLPFILSHVRLSRRQEHLADPNVLQHLLASAEIDRQRLRPLRLRRRKRDAPAVRAALGRARLAAERHAHRTLARAVDPKRNETLARKIIETADAGLQFKCRNEDVTCARRSGRRSGRRRRGPWPRTDSPRRRSRSTRPGACR